jgi:asparagine synthase (glutamine-hydrolysing)
MTKALLKRAAQGLLPEEIIYRGKKGFAVPLARWLNGRLSARLTAVIDHSPLWQTGLLRQEIFRHWRDEHAGHVADRSRPLWALLVLDHWHRRIAS